MEQCDVVMNHFSFDWDPLVPSIGPLPQLLSQLGKLIVRLLRLGSRLAQWIQLPWGSISHISHIQSVNVSIAQSYSKKHIQYMYNIYIYIIICIYWSLKIKRYFCGRECMPVGFVLKSLSWQCEGCPTAPCCVFL